jgi:FAD/FMN-containing dehydrogenase
VNESALVTKLSAVVGAENVLSDFAARQYYSMDFSEEVAPVADIVVRPKTVDEISAVVRIANEHAYAVNTRGGGMSYSKGHVPIKTNTIIIDNNLMNRVVEVNVTDRYITVETGARWVDIRAALKGTGYRVPYLGTLSGNYATLGGGLSQNATGMGRTTLADHVLGLEVVLGDGRVIKTGSSITKNTGPFYRYNGPDLTGLFLCDSGAFGIKTKAHLFLEPWPKMAFGCVSFPDRIALTAAQIEMAKRGLHTEAFAFDGKYLNEYAKNPPPPKEQRQQMVADFLRDNPVKWRAYRALFGAWHKSGLGFLSGLPNAMYFIAEGHDQASAERSRDAIMRICKQFGARKLPTTIPFGLRYGPYLNVGDIMANRDGQVNFPINAKFEVSKSGEAIRAFEDFLIANKPITDKHGIHIACNTLLHGHFWGIEPVISWHRPLGPYRMHYASPERRARSNEIEENAERTAAAIDCRYRLTKMFRDLGSLHVQWAKAYPYADALEGQEVWGFLQDLKHIVDPKKTLNPGVLGLGL